MTPLLAAKGLAIGALATLVMDVSATFGRKLGIIRGAAPQWMGRWFAHLLHGTLSHRDIREVPPVPRELPIFLTAHYAIGAFLGLVYVLVGTAASLPITSPALGALYGFATNVFPWLIMFPALGFGLLGLRGPKEALLLRSSFVNHLVFGVAASVAARLIL